MIQGLDKTKKSKKTTYTANGFGGLLGSLDQLGKVD